MTRRRAPLLAGIALALAAGCTRPRAPGDPVPLAVNPSRAPADAPVQIEIAGRDLDAQVKTDFSAAGEGNGVDAGFAARLEPAAGAAVPLDAVRLTGRRTLVATVPAGLARGSYRLVVTDPAGRSGALERAYRVVSSAASVARFVVAVLEAPRAGTAFGVGVSAVDAAGAVVDGFDGTVTLSDARGALAPVTAGPFVLGRWGGTLVIPDVVTGDTLVATDAAARAGTSASFDVVAGPPVALAFPAAVAATAGACSPTVAVALRDASGHAAAAEADLVVQLQSSPPGLPFFSDGGCTVPVATLTIPAGAGTAGFRFRAAAAGAVTLRAVPAAFPSAQQVVAVVP